MDQLLIRNVRDHFLEQFRTTPLLVFSPGRINLIGEHTDYNKGYVFPAAIDLGIVLAIQKSNDPMCSAIAIDRSETFTYELSQLEAVANGGWQNYILGVVDEIQKKESKYNLSILFLEVTFHREPDYHLLQLWKMRWCLA